MQETANIMAHRGCVIFVGSLPLDVREREIEDLFHKVRFWEFAIRRCPFLYAQSSAVKYVWCRMGGGVASALYGFENI